MKIILDTSLKTDNIASVVASSSDPDFPASNLLNNFTTDIWRAAAGVTSCTLTIVISKGSGLELLNTNATAITATLGGNPLAVTVSDLPGSAGRIWIDYPVQAGSHTIVLSLTAATAVSAGILRAGEVRTFNDPKYDNSENAKDYSIELELNNGADYFRKRDVVRTFANLSILETRANAIIFKQDIFDAIGPQPVAIRLIHKNATDKEWVLFAKRVSSPEIVHSTKTHSLINFDLKEVI